MRALLIGLCGALACSGIADASWEFTKWGMSVDEVRDAAPMRVSRVRNDDRLYKRIAKESSVLAYANRYQWYGYVVELRFGFDRYAKLNRVYLVTTGDRFDAIAGTLTGIFGQPVSESRSPVPCRLWRDPARADSIRLRLTGSAIVETMALQDEPPVGCAGAGRAADDR
jgi:hypothetical protein